MRYPIHIRLSGLESSVALTAAVETHASGLPWVESQIIGCWVGVHCDSEQLPAGAPYSVRLDVLIPGHELVAQRVQNSDLHLALEQAFDDIKQKLQAVDPTINHAEYAATVNGDLLMSTKRTP